MNIKVGLLFMLFTIAILTHEIIAVQPELCTMVPEGGMCMALFKRYAYMPSTGQCEEFPYGGCGGNANNFESKEACENMCKNHE